MATIPLSPYLLLKEKSNSTTDDPCEAIRQFPPLANLTISLLISILIVIANVQLIAVIFYTRELRRQVPKMMALSLSIITFLQRFNLYIICLAFTDLAVGLFLPFSAFRGVVMVHSTAVCDLLNSSIIFFINASIYMFVGLNLDRLHAIIRPLEYKSQAKQWTTIFFLVLAFLVAFICTAPFWVHHKMPKDGCYCQYPGFTDVSFEFPL